MRWITIISFIRLVSFNIIIVFIILLVVVVVIILTFFSSIKIYLHYYNLYSLYFLISKIFLIS